MGGLIDLGGKKGIEDEDWGWGGWGGGGGRMINLVLKFGSNIPWSYRPGRGGWPNPLMHIKKI